jgi:hypothetical protein
MAKTFELAVDERFFIGSLQSTTIQADLVKDIVRFNARITFCEFPYKNPSHRPEAIAIAGVLIAVVGTVTSLLSLLNDKKPKVTHRMLADEIRAYFELRGIKDYSISRNESDEQILSDGAPCHIRFKNGIGQECSVFFGVNDNKIWVSSQETNWRSLNF